MNSSRRDLMAGLFGASDPAAVVPKAAAAADDPSLPAPDPIALLLNRTSFGMREEDYQRATSMGADAWLEEQLAYESLDDSALESAIAAALPTVGMTNGQILSLVAATEQQFKAVDELRGATLVRQIYSPRQLFEVMVEFWTNHFNMLHIDGPVRYFKTVDDREVIRRHALGRFGEMLHASARSPAMLNSLDNVTNVVNGPNENYARELMELHTIGVDGGYTEDDVKAVARCFTGWTTTPFQGGGDVTFFFFATRHDYNAKTVLGMPIPAGQGEQDGNQVLDLLISHPATARYLSTKLARRFVSDDPPASLVDRMAASFTASGGDIRTVLRTLFRSDEFKASGDQKYKRPAEFVISTVRTLAPQLGGSYVRTLAEQLVALGQMPYMWPTPDGYPDAKQHWINTSAQVSRWNFGFGMAENTLSTGIRVDVPALIGTARTAEELVDRLAARLLHRPLAAGDRALLIGHAANRGMSHRPLAAAVLVQRAQELIGILLGSAYFQYR